MKIYFLMVLLCIPITHAMIGTSGTNYRPIITDKNISTLTTATISFFMYPEQITGRNFYIMQFGKNGIGDSTFTQSIYMASSKLYLLDDYSSTNDEGLWSVPIYNTTPQAICLRYNMNGNINNDPTFMINGTSMTVTEEITPTGILSHSTGKIWFLSGYKTSESGRFVGMMGEVAIWNVTLNDSQCKTLTTTWKSGIPLTIAPGNLVSYWRMDEGPHTADTGANKTLQPSADSSIQWYSGGFADIADKSTANYIEADKDSGDNSDSDVFTLEDFTLPAGSIVTGVSASLNGYDDFGTGRTTVSLTKNGAWMTNTSVLPVAAYSNVFWNFNTVTDMPTQTDINNMLIGFKASLSTSHDYLDVYHAYVDIYYTNFTIRDYKGNNHIYALGGVGKGVKFYSYAE